MSNTHPDTRWAAMYDERRPVRLAIIHLIDMAVNQGSVEIDEAREELWKNIRHLCEEYYEEFNTQTMKEAS